MTSALDRLIANNEKAREPIRLPHQRDPGILVRYRLIDLDDIDAARDVPMSDDRDKRQAATILADACVEILDITGDTPLSIHPDGETITFESAWLAKALGIDGDRRVTDDGEGWTPADVAQAFYPVKDDVVLTQMGLRKASKLGIPNPT